jgi:hypothetical protein
MPIANYTTQVPADNSAAEIEKMLRVHNATDILKRYENGELCSLTFIVPTRLGKTPFSLPANIDAVHKVLERQHVKANIERSQARRVAWRILRDWVRAQMAIIDTEMVNIDEVFMPYIALSSKRTFYQALQDGTLKLPQQGTPG